jgi:hypothetical protein
VFGNFCAPPSTIEVTESLNVSAMSMYSIPRTLLLRELFCGERQRLSQPQNTSV